MLDSKNGLRFIVTIQAPVAYISQTLKSHMFLKKPNTKTVKTLFSSQKNPIFSLVDHEPRNQLHNYRQTKNYVEVYMKWKKDPYFDSIEHIHRSLELKPIISLKNIIAQNPNGCIPISDISKKGLQFDVKIKVAKFLRQYPSIFEEFIGPKYNLPWFRLTQEAIEIDEEEKRVFEECREDLIGRLKKLILMSKENVLPLKIIQGMLWYLGLPDDFLKYPDENFGDIFKVVELEDGIKGLKAGSSEKTLSFLQRNAMANGVYSGKSTEAIGFPLFPSKGLRLKRKIQNWLKEFQELPYISPYEDYSNLDANTDIAEKRVVGFLHELLCLFVEHSAERKRLLCLKKYFGLPQKVHKAFERHPHIFYLSFKNKTCTAILKEAYGNAGSVQRHPMLVVRKRYIELVKESERIVKRKRLKKKVVIQSQKMEGVDDEEGIV